jgi:hypothetical protein
LQIAPAMGQSAPVQHAALLMQAPAHSFCDAGQAQRPALQVWLAILQSASLQQPSAGTQRLEVTHGSWPIGHSQVPWLQI